LLAARDSVLIELLYSLFFEILIHNGEPSLEDLFEFKYIGVLRRDIDFLRWIDVAEII